MMTSSIRIRSKKMFERYTEQARRVLFYARYETGQLGDHAIDTEHLLLGLMQERQNLVGRIFDKLQVPMETIWTELANRKGVHEPLSKSVEIPFSIGTQRVLNLAVEEANRLQDRHVDSEHLLLGLLREKGSVAESILAKHGLSLDGVRAAILSLRRAS
jgi:ATP-dependent Clp protease ATP-binding subunit ClpC